MARISGLAKNGIPAHSLCIWVQLQHDSQVLQWILLQDSTLNLLTVKMWHASINMYAFKSLSIRLLYELSIKTLPWCSEGSLDLWTFQDSAKVCVHHLVHGKAGKGKETQILLTEYKS